MANCPQCNCRSTVKDSRPDFVLGVSGMRRRRLCAGCNYVWSTVEIDDEFIKRILKLIKLEEQLRNVLNNLK